MPWIPFSPISHFCCLWYKNLPSLEEAFYYESKPSNFSYVERVLCHFKNRTKQDVRIDLEWRDRRL